MKLTHVKSAKPRLNMFYVQVLLAFLTVLSGIATADGFSKMLAGEGELTDETAITAILLSVVIVLVMALSVSTYLRKKDPIFLTGYLSALSVSVLLGMSFYSEKLGFMHDFIQQQLSVAAQQVVSQIEPVVQTTRYALKKSENLREYSLTQADIEAQPEKGGCYTRCKYRASNAGLITLFHEDFSEKVTQLESLMMSLYEPQTAETKRLTLERLNRELSYLSSNAVMVQFTQELQQIINAWKTGIVTTRDTAGAIVSSQKLYKKDAEFVALAESLLVSLQAIKAEPVALDVLHGENVALKRSVDVIVAIVTGKFDRVSTNDWLALCLALLIDIGILYLSYVKANINWTAERVSRATRESQFKLALVKNMLTFSQLTSGRELALLLESRATDKQEHVLIKTEGDSVQLELVCISLESIGVAKKQTTNGFHNWVMQWFGTSKYTKYYQIPREAFNDIKLAATQYDCEFNPIQAC